MRTVTKPLQTSVWKGEVMSDKILDTNVVVPPHVIRVPVHIDETERHPETFKKVMVCKVCSLFHKSCAKFLFQACMIVFKRFPDRSLECFSYVREMGQLQCFYLRFNLVINQLYDE